MRVKANQLSRKAKMDRQKRAQLLQRLDDLQDRLPGDQLKAAFERFVKDKADEFTKTAGQDVAIKMVNEMSRKLDRFRADFDLRGMSSEIDGRSPSCLE